MERPAVHQFLHGLLPGDAISNHALILQRYLRAWGYASEIYAAYRDPALAGAARDYRRYRAHSADWLIYHYSTGSPLTAYLQPLAKRLILHYHNITPPELFRSHSPQFRAELERGRAELARLHMVLLAVADSDYNRQDLVDNGYLQPVTAPVLIDFARLDLPAPPLWQDGAVNWLFVGRIVPNKCQADLIALFAHYQRWVEPQARLILVGSAEHASSYQLALEVEAESLGVKSRVEFMGKVSEVELAACYHTAQVFVSASEHEGLGVPLLEALYCGVPVVAYASTAVPATLGQAGILFHRKDWAALAELIDRVVKDSSLRIQLIARGRERAAQFEAEAVAARWRALIEKVVSSQGKA